MPLTDATNAAPAPNLHTSVASKKRVHDVAATSDENTNTSVGGSGKRQRLNRKDSDEFTSNVYTTLPPPTKSYIQLRLQLSRFKGVYRIVQLPLTFTFANLHRFILYVFGWNGSHAHQAYVWTNVELYKTKPGEIKKCGRAPPLPEEPSDWELQYWDWFVMGKREPVHYVVAKGQGKRGQGYFDEYLSATTKEDQELTLGDLWNLDEDQNISEGECDNEEIGIKYEYDLGCESYVLRIASNVLNAALPQIASWDVHVTCDGTEGPFFEYTTPRNLPNVLTAKGAVGLISFSSVLTLLIVA